MNKCVNTYRIGNEIQVKWPITTNGEEQTLDGRKISLYLIDPLNRKHKVERFGTERNVVVFTMSAQEQNEVGIYSMLLVENEGEPHQLSVDYCNAFRLVSHSCEIPSDMAAGDIPLDSTNVDAGIHGLSAYEIAVNYGYEGSEEQWASEFNTVLKSTELIIESVNKAGKVLERSEELFEGLSDIQKYEQGRRDAEKDRVEAEKDRQSAETLRKEAETLRADAETKRQEAETRRSEEFSQTIQSNANSFTTQQVAFSEAFETSQRQRAKYYEDSEVARQSNFVESEQSREQRYVEFIGEIEKNENKRKSEEQERISLETQRKRNESQREEAETIRQQNENKRMSAENKRISEEDDRVAAETQRKRNEQQRIENDGVLAENERIRVAAENKRDEAEYKRVLAENERQSAEKQRSEAETKRNNNFSAAIKSMDEKFEEKTNEYNEQFAEMLKSGKNDIKTAIDEFNRTEHVLTQEEFDALVASGELVEGCDYKIIEDED